MFVEVCFRLSLNITENRRLNRLWKIENLLWQSADGRGSPLSGTLIVARDNNVKQNIVLHVLAEAILSIVDCLLTLSARIYAFAIN